MVSRDLVLAGRVLRRNPVFTLTAVLTIALGVGASSAIFSITNAVLLRPLPYRDSDRLVIAGMELRQRNVKDLPFSNADFIDLREGTKAFMEDLAGVSTAPGMFLREDGSPEQLRVAVATTNFFDLTGARVVYGRGFTPEDGIPQPPAPPVADGGTAPAPLPAIAVLSYEYFQRRYGGNPLAIGHSLQTVGGSGPIIVGVLEPGFQLYFPPGANVESSPDLWIANRLAYDAANRLQFGIRPVGRLKPAASLERAQSAADSIAAETRRNFPISRTAGYNIALEPMRQHLVAEVQPAILALMGSVIFLLLIACANVANLLLVRAGLREPELAICSAMGASRWRLCRPLLAEASLLAAGGTLVGLALAWAGIQFLRALAPANLPRLDTIRIDGGVFAFTAAAGVAAAAIFGMVPAWRASRPDAMNILRGSSRNAGFVGGGWLRNLVVMTEVALAFVLLVGSGLMFRSFLELQRVDPGFDTNHLLTFQVLGIQQVGKSPEQRFALIRELKQRLGALSGVQSVTASFPFPLTGNFNVIRWGKEEALSDASRFRATEFQVVLPGYFETMRTRLLEGRTFTDDDNLPGRNRVIIDRFLANKAFPGESAVGKRILIRIRTPEAEWVEVVGVVEHQHTTTLAAPGREEVYFTDAFLGSGAIRSWAVRAGADAAGYENQVRAVVKGLDPHLLVARVEPGASLVSRAQQGTRFSLLLITLFAIVAGTLAGIGLYGVLATSVRQRTGEIGVRIALGAARGSIFKLVVRRGLGLSAAGIGVGIVVAFLLTRVMATMLVGVKPSDPATFAAMILIFFAIAAVASWLPARRAAHLDPMSALRGE